MTTEAHTAEDPRPTFTRALDQAERQVAAVRPDEMTGPTPCTEYDVRALLGHVVMVLHMLAHAGKGGDALDAPNVVDGVADDGWADAFARGRSEVEQVWADDEKLDSLVRLPWAQLPGRIAIEAYTHELTVHSWDIARATGRLADLDPDLGARALEGFSQFAPPETRSEQGPFGPIVPVSDDADVYTRLAAFLGRRP